MKVISRGISFFLFFCSMLYAKDASNPYLYTRGFLYSKKPSRIPKHYSQVTPYLWVDPHVNVFTSPKEQVCLLGFAVDVRDSDVTQQEIVDKLEKALSISEEAFHAEGDYICGRYAIFYQACEGSLKVVSDAAGFRKIYYSPDSNIITGHAKLLAENLTERQVASKFIDTGSPGEWPKAYPGCYTAYKNVSCLMPNHSVEIGSGKVDRFFPREQFSPLSKEEAIDRFCKLARESLKGAEKQQEKPLIFSITAGLDSRATLSFTDTLKQLPIGFTYFGSITEDLPHAEKICSQFNLTHITAEDYPKKISRQLRVALESNCYYLFVHFNYYLTQSILEALGEDQFLMINSNLLEIGRGWCGMGRYHHGVDSYPANTEYAKSTGLHCETLLGYDIRQLFFWEQQLGAYLTLHLFGYDVACDVFNPYNCRAILDTMLRSTNLSDNNMMWGKVQEELIRRSWLYTPEN